MKTFSVRFCSRLLPALGRSAALAAGLMLAAPTFAADDEDYGNSLDWAPASASVYTSSLRIKEQIDVIAESNAWKKFVEIPSVAMGWQMAQMQINNPEGPAAMFWQLMELPENQQLAKLLGEMFSEEVVFIAGEDFPKFMELLSIVQGSRLAPMIEAMNAAGGHIDPNEARMRAVADAIAEDPELLTVPDMLMAFKVKDNAAGETQLKRLEVVVKMALKNSKTEIEFERETINEVEYLVLNLDGSTIPWPEEKPAGLQIDEKTYDSLKEIISDKKIAVALGVWDTYVVLSIGESTEQLATLGDEDNDLLVETDSFEPLLPHLEEEEGDLVGVQFISAGVMKAQMLSAADLDDAAEELGALIEASDDIDDELKGELSEDLVELASDLKPYLPKPGDIAGCTLKTEEGFESFTYNWAENTRLDGSLPLELTNHVGGNPVFAFVGRGVSDPEAYALLAKWVGKGIEYFEGYGLAEMDEDDRAEAEKVLEVVKPLLAKIDEATREHLIPALEDGQGGFVLDADITSKKWQGEMPESYAELPMAEVALVFGVSDADELKAAGKAYWSIAQEAVEAFKEFDESEVPEDFELPEPEETEASDGSIYTWAAPSEAKLDDQIALAIGVGEHVATISSSPELAKRVLTETPWESFPVGSADEPRAAVVGFDFPALIDAVTPWVDYGIRSSVEGEEAAGKEPEDGSQAGEIISQVHTGLEVLKCFRGVWSETVKEDDAWMTHSISKFEDLED
ncbi:hypothetical protein [Lacipirellula parvula]|uniref:Uncharacterized protein n=1 Tax=Lacipirellula parvula TaxID=2650471 RepID=A0A5K7X7R0_9BACT|nr:hypothetical protein [Lacipirellula parvula]BBO32425.1 hypothetical protein PLANPX_2037 [Lacipirellula parvula]